MTDSPYRAYGFPDEPGESRYIPAKEGKYRPATAREIMLNLKHLREDEVMAVFRAGICFKEVDGEAFMIDNMAKVESIIMEKIIREL